MSPPFRQYVEAGLSAIPVRADGSKAPTGPWRQYIDRQPSPEEADSWARQYRGIAIIGGRVSGNLEILDFDEPTIVRPFLTALREQDVGLYDRLCLIRTPRRNESGQAGCHVLYRCESAVGGNAKLAMSEPEPAFNDDGTPQIDPNRGTVGRVLRCDQGTVDV